MIEDKAAAKDACKKERIMRSLRSLAISLWLDPASED